MAEDEPKELSPEELRQRLSAAKKELEEDVSPDFLSLIAQTSGGFRYIIDFSLLESNTTGRTYYADMSIHINPAFLLYFDKKARRGVVLHEVGHHVPPVLELRHRLTARLTDPDIIPEKYRASPEIAERFLQAINHSVNNLVLDIWDEAYMSRPPFTIIREAITEIYMGIGKRQLKQLSLPEQLVQLFAREARYPSPTPIDQLVNPEVLEAYQKITSSGALRTLQQTSYQENIFSTPWDIKQDYQRKMNAQEVFLTEYLKLLELEVKKRKEQKEKGESDQERESDPGGKKLEQSTTEQLLDELTQAGKKREPVAPSEEDKKQAKALGKAIEKAAKEAAEKAAGKNPENKEVPKPDEEDPFTKLSRQIGKRMQEVNSERQRGLADTLQTSPEIIQKWEDIKKKYALEIQGTASVLAEVFLEDRRKKLEYLRRQGEIVPGLEAETIGAFLSGENDPNTKFEIRANPQFIETEIEFVVDTSGSMSGEPIDSSIEMLIIITEAFKLVKEQLGDENLLNESEEPLKLGVTKFSVSAQTITPSSEPVSDKKQTKIIEELSKIGGGTDETQVLNIVINRLIPLPDNIIKIIIVLSDGQGNKESVSSIVQNVEADNKIIFLAVGIGSNSKDVVNTYLGPLKRKDSNVFGDEAQTPKEILPKVVEFIKSQVLKRKPYL